MRCDVSGRLLFKHEELFDEATRTIETDFNYLSEGLFHETFSFKTLENGLHEINVGINRNSVIWNFDDIKKLTGKADFCTLEASEWDECKYFYLHNNGFVIEARNEEEISQFSTKGDFMKAYAIEDISGGYVLKLAYMQEAKTNALACFTDEKVAKRFLKDKFRAKKMVAEILEAKKQYF